MPKLCVVCGGKINTTGYNKVQIKRAKYDSPGCRLRGHSINKKIRKNLTNINIKQS